jgi:hypothetical protein
MMNRGQVIKVKSGHDANCSSGMIALTVLMGAAVTLLPISLIVAGIQAANLGRGQCPRRRALYWIVPVGLGLVATLVAAGWVTSLGYSDSYLVRVVVVVGGSFILAGLTGYMLAPRMNRPAWLVLLAPLILVAGGAALFVSTTGALYAVGLGLIVVVLSGLAGSGS